MLSRLPGLTRNKPIHLAYLLLRASKKCTKPIPSWRGFKPSLIPTTNTRECLSKGAGKDFPYISSNIHSSDFQSQRKGGENEGGDVGQELEGNIV